MLLFPFIFGLQVASGCPGWPNCVPQPQPVAQQVAPANNSVTVYHINSPAIHQEVTLQQIQAIGLNCVQKDVIIGYLEAKVSPQPRDPETMDSQTQKLNSVARTKIWQLRTYCP